MNDSPEISNRTSEKSTEVFQSAAEQIEKLNKNEKPIESSETGAEKIEKARMEVLKSSISSEKESKKSEKANPPRRGPISKSIQDESYKKIMAHVQNELSPTGKAFSKFIHNKAVEKTSEAIGKTIARPNSILAGAFVAFVATLLTYTIAKTVGYKLSGFETIAAFIIGWSIGAIYDYIKIIITGKR